MSGSESYPPPGSSGQEPPAPPPAAPPPPGWQPPPPTAAPTWSPYPPPPAGAPTGPPLPLAFRPGAVPLRPLGLGDIFDAAFRIIRHNPRATVGSALLVTAAAMAVPVLATAALAWVFDVALAPGADLGDESFLAALGLQALGWLLQSVGLILVTGMVAHVTMAAAVGRTLSLAQAWAATRGKRARLFGLVALLGVMLVLLVVLFVLLWLAAVAALSGWLQVLVLFFSVPLFVGALWWFWVRIYYLPVPALMLEDVGIFGAIERGHALTRGAFWRVFGIALLTSVVAGIASLLLTVPIGLVTGALSDTGMSSEVEAVWSSVVSAISAVVQSAFVAPFAAVVTSLQYVDQRIRKEAFDVELMTRAGVAGR